MHRIWQRTGKYPTEVLNIPENKVDTRGLQAFIYASEIYAIEDENKRNISCPLLSKKGGK